MAAVLDILNIVCPVFLIIALGWFLGRKQFITAEANRVISKIVFYVAAPLLLFRGAARTSLSESVHLNVLLVTAGVTAVYTLIVYFTMYRGEPARRGVFAQGVYRSNLLFVGLPVVFNAFGEQVLGPASVFIGFMVVVFNFLAVIVLALPRRHEHAEQRGVWLHTTVGILKNPLIIGSIAGLLASVSGITIPTAVDRSCKSVGELAMPLALLSVGAGLDFGRLKREVKPAVLVCFFKLILYPALIYIGLRIVGVSGIYLQFAVLLNSTPTAVVSFIMAQEMDGDENLAAAVVISTTTASLFTISMWLALLRYLL